MASGLLFAIVFVKVLLCKPALTTTITSSVFDRDSKLDNLFFTDNLLFENAAWYVLDCAHQCSENGQCVAFTFIPGFLAPGSCRAHSAALTSASSDRTSANGAETFMIVATEDNRGEKQNSRFRFAVQLVIQ